MNIANIFELSLQEDLTFEMIQSQTDVAFINDLRKDIEYIKNVIDVNDIRKASKLDFNYPEANAAVRRVSDTLTKRFGFNINIFLRDHLNCSTNVVVPGSFNVLNGSNDWFDGMKEYFKAKGSKVYKDIKSFIDFTKNIDDYYNLVYTNIKEMEKVYDKFNIVVDNKNAKIHGLPKDFSVLLTMDLCYYLNSKGVNASVDELIAIILHEIGHNFTSFEKLYYKVKNSIVVLEAIRETVSNNVKDNITALRLVSKRLGGPVTGNGETELLIDISNKLTGEYGDDKFGQINRTSAEQQADQFVSRFGMGAALVTGLTRTGYWVRPKYDELEQQIGMSILLAIVLNGYAIWILAGAMVPIGTGVLVLVSTMIASGLIIAGSFSTVKRVTQDYFKHINLYEMDYQRLLRVKQDCIRQIRMLDKKTEKLLLENLLFNIKVVEERLRIIDDIVEYKKANSFIDKYLLNNLMDPKTKSILNISDITQSLMENDLHYKIKTLKG